MAQGDRFQQQRGAGSGFASGQRERYGCRHRHKGRLSPDVRNHQRIRADYVLRNHRWALAARRLSRTAISLQHRRYRRPEANRAQV